MIQLYHMEDAIIDLLPYTVPAIVTGFVAFYFFSLHTKNEEKRMKVQLLKEKHKEALPLRIQAYERMVLFLERIHPAKILLRVAPLNQDAEYYAQQLIQHIEQEFEHNLVQQIYFTDECWQAIVAAKNATSHIFKQTAIDADVKDSQALREVVLKKVIEGGAPSETSIAFIKEEVRGLF